MNIALGADRLGFPLKEAVKAHLIKAGHQLVDVGTVDLGTPLPYMEAADNVAKAIIGKQAERGFVFCGTGMGVSIAANKHKGIYCACVESYWTARMSRMINNANVMAMGNSVVGVTMALDMVDVFLNTEFCQGDPEERVKLISGLLDKLIVMENANLK